MGKDLTKQRNDEPLTRVVHSNPENSDSNQKVQTNKIVKDMPAENENKKQNVDINLKEEKIYQADSVNSQNQTNQVVKENGEQPKQNAFFSQNLNKDGPKSLFDNVPKPKSDFIWGIDGKPIVNKISNETQSSETLNKIEDNLKNKELRMDGHKNSLFANSGDSLFKPQVSSNSNPIQPNKTIAESSSQLGSLFPLPTSSIFNFNGNPSPSLFSQPSGALFSQPSSLFGTSGDNKMSIFGNSQPASGSIFGKYTLNKDEIDSEDGENDDGEDDKKSESAESKEPIDDGKNVKYDSPYETVLSLVFEDLKVEKKDGMGFGLVSIEKLKETSHDKTKESTIDVNDKINEKVEDHLNKNEGTVLADSEPNEKTPENKNQVGKIADFPLLVVRTKAKIILSTYQIIPKGSNSCFLKNNKSCVSLIVFKIEKDKDGKQQLCKSNLKIKFSEEANAQNFKEKFDAFTGNN